MTTAVAQFDVLEKAGDGGDYSSITDTYLEPLRLNLTPPEYSRLEKPSRPPIPEVKYLIYCCSIKCRISIYSNYTLKF